MMSRIHKIKLLSLVIFAVLFYSCNERAIKFNFSGKKVLYSDKIERKHELVLLNLDTKEEIRFDNFEGIDPSGFLLFKEGRSIFVENYNFGSAGRVFIYDVLKDAEIEIDIHSKNNEMAGFSNVNIYNKNFYFTSENKIFAHSLNDFTLVKEYTTDSVIAQLAVYNEDLFAIVYDVYDNEHDAYGYSSTYLYDFNNKTKTEIPYRAGLYDWSNDRKKLLFNARGPKIMDYPSMEVHPIEAIEKDSLEIYSWMKFVGNDEIAFTGFRKGGNHFESTNLYLLNLQTEKIEQITFSNTPKEIKSASY
jgi:Tol biopolymer transport system component